MYRLLLADDEKQITEGLKCFLSWEKYQITEIRTANTYEEALGIGLSFRPHIAIFDVCMGDRFGFDLLRKLQKDLPELHVIMISGYDEFSYVREALRQGAIDYLLKPIDRRELEKVLKNIVVEKLCGSILKTSEEEAFDDILQKDERDLNKLVRKIIKIVHEEYDKNLNLSMLADRLEVNNGYLGKLFLKEAGMKFSQYLMQYRMNAAKDFLVHTDYKVSYIAKRVGYTNANYFYRHFQMCHKKSPSDFREI